MQVRGRWWDFGETGLWQQRFQHWLRRRVPPTTEVTLDRFRLFVFPSRAGFGYLLTCGLIWLLGTNYDNNLSLALAFLMLSLMIVAIIHTFNNLSGVTLKGVGSSEAYAGELVEFQVLLSRRPNKRHENIQLMFHSGDASVTTVDLVDCSEARAKLFVPSTQRGWLNPGRLLVETHYPLGLIRVWTWLDLDVRALVYPAPMASATPAFQGAQQGEGRLPHEEGGEDFAGLKDYQPGHSLRHVAWKQYARGRGLHLKDFADYRVPNRWLDWDSLEGVPTEERLSRLCYWVNELAKTQTEYGLRLPGVELVPSSGLEHKRQCLRALASFRAADGRH